LAAFDKGKIEAVIRYLKRGFLVGRSFQDLTDLERQWQSWLEEVADGKPHGTTGRPPAELFEEEQYRLQPILSESYLIRPAFRTQQVHRDGRVKVLGNRYSAPVAYHGQAIKVRVTEEKVELYDLQENHLFSHWRSLEKGKSFTEAEHYRKEHEISTDELIHQVVIRLESREFCEELKKKFPRHLREQCRQILNLEKRFERKLLQAAAQRLLQHRCVSYGNLKKTVEYLASQEQLEELGRQTRRLESSLPQDLGVQLRPAGYYDQVYQEVSDDC